MDHHLWVVKAYKIALHSAYRGEAVNNDGTANSASYNRTPVPSTPSSSMPIASPRSQRTFGRLDSQGKPRNKTGDTADFVESRPDCQTPTSKRKQPDKKDSKNNDPLVGNGSESIFQSVFGIFKQKSHDTHKGSEVPPPSNYEGYIGFTPCAVCVAPNTSFDAVSAVGLYREAQQRLDMSNPLGLPFVHPWDEFLDAEFVYPDHPRERLRSNLVHFLGNYLTVIFYLMFASDLAPHLPLQQGCELNFLQNLFFTFFLLQQLLTSVIPLHLLVKKMLVERQLPYLKGTSELSVIKVKGLRMQSFIIVNWVLMENFTRALVGIHVGLWVTFLLRIVFALTYIFGLTAGLVVPPILSRLLAPVSWPLTLGLCSCIAHSFFTKRGWQRVAIDRITEALQTSASAINFQ